MLNTVSPEKLHVLLDFLVMLGNIKSNTRNLYANTNEVYLPYQIYRSNGLKVHRYLV
jgi:hypothetical protein